MAQSFRSSIIVAVLVAVMLVVFGLRSHPTVDNAPASTTANISSVSYGPGATCHSINGLPDGDCTPGAIDPAVTQQNIASTICRSGYTATVRPSTSVTNPMKEESMRKYGATGSKVDYEYDHLIALEIGGAPDDSKNLWPEAYLGVNGARKKDVIENTLHTLVCNGSIPLVVAQQAIATDWEKAYATYVAK